MKRISISFVCLVMLVAWVNISTVKVQSLYTDVSQYPALVSDSLFLYSPSVLNFDIQSFLDTLPGPLRDYSEELNDHSWTAAEIIRFNAMHYGINPQLVLVLLEAETEALTNPTVEIPKKSNSDQAGQQEPIFYNYVKWISENLLSSYDNYRYSNGEKLVMFSDGESLEVPTHLNAGTYAVQATLAKVLPQDEWGRWVQGVRPLFLQQYSLWFGDPQYNLDAVRATTFTLPNGYILPFTIGETWFYTGGPHNYVGGTVGCTSGPNCSRPWSAVDIAPPERISCPNTKYPANRWVVAAQGGTVVESSPALVVIDHGDGWRSYYSHIASAERVARNTVVQQGQRIGHPSCETEPGGSTSGVHLHFAIWQVGVGFVDIAGNILSSWTIQETTHYNGTMNRNDVLRTASTGRLIGTNDILNSPYDDNFNTDDLDSKWYWIREVPTHWSLTDRPGYLRILTQQKDIWQNNNTAPLLLQSLQPFSSVNFEIRTRVSITPIADHHQGGLVIYDDDDNYVRFTYAYISGPTFEFAKEINGNFQPIQVPAPADINSVHLRIIKVGQTYYGYYSQDGDSWTVTGVHQNVSISPSDIGLTAFNAEDVTSLEIPADFDYFQMLDNWLIYLPMIVR